MMISFDLKFNKMDELEIRLIKNVADLKLDFMQV